MASTLGLQNWPQVSVDAVEVRNNLQGGLHPQAIENKKTEYVLQKRSFWDFSTCISKKFLQKSFIQRIKFLSKIWVYIITCYLVWLNAQAETRWERKAQVSFLFALSLSIHPITTINNGAQFWQIVPIAL